MSVCGFEKLRRRYGSRESAPPPPAPLGCPPSFSRPLALFTSVCFSLLLSMRELSRAFVGRRLGSGGVGASLPRPVSSRELLRSAKPESRGGLEWRGGMRLGEVWGGKPPPRRARHRPRAPKRPRARVRRGRGDGGR